MPKRSELGELVRAEPETDRDRVQIAARYYRSLGYRVRVFARVVRADGRSTWSRFGAAGTSPPDLVGIEREGGSDGSTI